MNNENAIKKVKADKNLKGTIGQIFNKMIIVKAAYSK